MKSLDEKFDLILSILLAISISELFKKFSTFQTDFLVQWIILSVLFFTLSTILIYYMVMHKSLNLFSFILKTVTLYLLVFFPYYVDKLKGDMVYIKIYLIITSISFIVWGLFESIKKKEKWYVEPRFLIGVTALIILGISFVGVKI